MLRVSESNPQIHYSSSAIGPYSPAYISKQLSPRSHSCEKHHIYYSFVMSVRRFTCITATPTERISVKFGTRDLIL